MERRGFRVGQESVNDKWEKQLIRKGVKLYGTPWCSMCSKQRAVLFNVCDSWERFYIDCDSLRNVLECSTVKKIPSWRVAGKLYVGAQSETSLKQLIDSSKQGIQRWDVAEFTRRHRRRGKWAKEEFADAVRRSIFKARAAAADPPPPAVDGPKASDIPESGEMMSDAKGFMVLNSAGRPDYLHPIRGNHHIEELPKGFTNHDFQRWPFQVSEKLTI